MDNTKFNKNEISMHSACDIDSTLLMDFYKKVFPKRINYLESNWKWLNRSGFCENKIPLVLIYKNQVIAHAGMIPCNISFSGDLRTASGFIDFMVLPDFQRHGLGTILIREWMNCCDCYIGIGFNDKSIGVFKQCGWIESFDTYMHLNFIRPFNHPRFVRRLSAFLRNILNGITYPFFFLIYKKNSYSKKHYRLEKLNETSFRSFINLYNKSKQNINNTISPIRDNDYAKWRIFNSPNIDKYSIYKTETFNAIVSPHNDYGEYIDILWVSDIHDKIEIKKMISTLGICGLKNGFSYIRFYTSDKELSNYLKKSTKSIVRHPRVAYFSQNSNILEELKTLIWELELIDTDFEKFK